MQSADQAEAAGRRYAEVVGADPTRDSFLSRDRAELVDATFELMARAERAGEPISLLWTPVIDGVLLFEDLFDAVRTGRTSTIPVLVGTTQNEFAWRTLRDQPYSEAADRQGQELFANAIFRRPTEAFAQLRDQDGFRGDLPV